MSKSVKFLQRSIHFLIKRNYTHETTTRNLSQINGILPPITTPFLPMQHEPISWEHLENNLKLWEKINFSGYVVHGSNGEYPFLTHEERVDLVKAVRDNTDKNKIIIAGASGESLKTTIKTCEDMAKHKADYVLILTPSFYKTRMTDTALLKFFTKVADKSPLPVILYNMPANTTIDMSVDLVIDLASHPNIVALKDSGGDIPKLGLINEQLKIRGQENFSVIAGSAGFLLDALKVGCNGGICALANVLGTEVVKLYDLFTSGNLPDAEKLQKKLIEPNKYVTRMLGVAALKASLDANGYYGGPVRLPLLPLNDTELESVKKAFLDNGYNWTSQW